MNHRLRMTVVTFAIAFWSVIVCSATETVSDSVSLYRQQIDRLSAVKGALGLRVVASTYGRIGDAYLRADSLSAAEVAYLTGLAIVEDDHSLRREFSHWYIIRLAHLYRKNGQTDLAMSLLGELLNNLPSPRQASELFFAMVAHEKGLLDIERPGGLAYEAQQISDVYGQESTDSEQSYSSEDSHESNEGYISENGDEEYWQQRNGEFPYRTFFARTPNELLDKSREIYSGVKHIPYYLLNEVMSVLTRQHEYESYTLLPGVIDNYLQGVEWAGIDNTPDIDTIRLRCADFATSLRRLYQYGTAYELSDTSLRAIAGRHYLKLLSKTGEGYEGNRALAAHCLIQLAAICFDVSDYKCAKGRATAALETIVSSSDARSPNKAQILALLAKSHIELQEFNDAIAPLQELSQFEITSRQRGYKRSNDYELTQEWVFDALAYVHLMRNDTVSLRKHIQPHLTKLESQGIWRNPDSKYQSTSYISVIAQLYDAYLAMHGGRESTADSLYDVLFTSSAYSFGVNQSFSVGAGSYRFAHLLAAARLRKKANDPVMMTYYYQEVLRSAPPSGLTHDVIEEALSSIIDYLNTISDENVSIDMDVLSDFNAIVDIASIRNGTVNINENLTFRYACAVYRVMYLSGISTYRYDRFNPYESFSDLKEWYASLKQKGQAERRAMDYLLYTDAIAKAEYPLAAEYLETLKPNGMNEEDVSQEQNVYMLTLKSLYSSLAKDHTNAMKFIREAERVANEVSSTINDKLIKVHIDRAYGEYYLQRNVLDSALIYLSLAVEGYSTMYSPRRYDLGSAQLSYTAALSLSGRTSEALYAYQDARLRGISMAHMTFAMIRPYVTALVKALSDNEKYYDAVALYEDELRILQEEHSESSPLLIEPLETMISLFPLKYQTKIFDNDNDEYSNYYQYDNYWLYSKCRAYRQWLTQLRGR